MNLVKSYGHKDKIVPISWSQMFNDGNLSCHPSSGRCILKLNTMCAQRDRPLPSRQQRYTLSRRLQPGSIDTANNTCPIDENIHSSFSLLLSLLEILPQKRRIANAPLRKKRNRWYNERQSAMERNVLPMQ